jgi:hypothetical protein
MLGNLQLVQIALGEIRTKISKSQSQRTIPLRILIIFGAILPKPRILLGEVLRQKLKKLTLTKIKKLATLGEMIQFPFLSILKDLLY